MRTLSLAALSLTLVLGACAVEDANQRGNETEEPSDGMAPASPGEAQPPQQPGNGEQAPEPSEDVTLSAAPATTSGGSTMTLTLNNRGQQQIGYNLCTSDLQTSGGQSVPTSRACTMELRTLEPGASADSRYELPINMVDGNYRFLTQVEWMQSGRRDAVRSNSFEVRAD